VTGASSVVRPAEGTRDQIVYIGSTFVFPDVMLRLVGSEISDIGTRRIERSEFDATGAPGGARLVVFEETYGASLFETPERMRSLCGRAAPVLAYRDCELARRLLHRQQDRIPSEQMRFLPISMPIEALVALMKVFLSGEILVPATLVGRSDAQEAPYQMAAERRPCEGLTARESEVLHLAAQGQRNKVIANALGLSEHTVKLHIHNIIAKLGVANRTEAASRYMAAQDRS